MKLYPPIAVTLPQIFPNEAEALCAIVSAGARIVHLRKPGASQEELRWLLSDITDRKVLESITIHYSLPLAEEFFAGGVHIRIEELDSVGEGFRKSLSCHRWEEVDSLAGSAAEYVFLSPVFDSVSKAGYLSGFDLDALEKTLAGEEHLPVVALGGITRDNIGAVKRMGFSGAAAIGSVWSLRGAEIDVKKSVENYIALMEAWEI